MKTDILGIKRYHRKPQTIEAKRWDPSAIENVLVVTSWLIASRVDFHYPVKLGGDFIIRTPEGPKRAEPGDWIIREIGTGRCFPCEAEEFEQTYTPDQDDQETAARLLARLGTDAWRWAREFMTMHAGRVIGLDEGTLDTMVAWFANAIEAGRTAGQSTHRGATDAASLPPTQPTVYNDPTETAGQLQQGDILRDNAGRYYQAGPEVRASDHRPEDRDAVARQRYLEIFSDEYAIVPRFDLYGPGPGGIAWPLKLIERKQT